jgi:sec-independent protein translocase protein TatB
MTVQSLMSSGELLLTAIVGLIVFGPSKLPMLATHLGQLLNKINTFKDQAALLWQEHLNKLQLQDNQRRAEEADKHYSDESSHPPPSA